MNEQSDVKLYRCKVLDIAYACNIKSGVDFLQLNFVSLHHQFIKRCLKNLEHICILPILVTAKACTSAGCSM